jgi:diacylglycerol kinase family enzyme
LIFLSDMIEHALQENSTRSATSFAVVANANSGAASQMGEAALVALVTAKLGGKLLSCVVVGSCDIEAGLQNAFASECDCVIVIGGDGTCRSGAKCALQTGKPVALLPGGTMNLLPAQHWPGKDVATALQALGDGHYRETTIDVGKVNDELFLIAAAFGAAPTLARLREEHRASTSLVGNIQALLKIPQVLPHLMRPMVRLEAPNVPRKSLTALAIVIGNADFALGRTDLEVCTHIFECVGARVNSHWDFLRVMARAFIDPKWREDDLVFTAAIKEGRVFSKSRAIAMTLDGEVMRLVSPARVVLLKRAVKVMVYDAPVALPDAPAVLIS